MSDSTAITNMNNQLSNIYTNLTGLQGSQINALTKQTNVMEIVEKENERLSSKEHTIDQAVENQNRIIYFNDNSRKITAAYLKILITITITLGMIFLVRVIYFHFGSSLPDMLFNVLMVVIISLGLIVCYNFYNTIRLRTIYDFDELNLAAPPTSDPTATTSPDSDFGSLVGCIGSQCCTLPNGNTPGTQWDPSKGRCVFSPAGSTIATPSSSTPPFTPAPSYSEVQSLISTNDLDTLASRK
jgi:hypothetical protein